MSEKFSVEDILNEVKSMNSDHYIAKDLKKSNAVSTEKSAQPSEINEDFKKPEEVLNKDLNESESFLPEDIDKNDDEENDSFDILKMSTEDFFRSIEQSSASQNLKFSDDSALENKPVSDEPVKKDIAEETEKNESASAVTTEEKTKPDEAPKPQAESDLEETKSDKKEKSSVFGRKKEKKQEQQEELENTVVYEKRELQDAITQQNSDDAFKPKKAVENEPKEQVNNEKIEAFNESVEFLESDISVKREHKPDHLLKPDEINSNDMGDSASLRFNDRIKDLTKSKKKKAESKDSNDSFAAFKKHEPITAAVKTEAKAQADELFDALSNDYKRKEKEVKEPDVLNNKIQPKVESEEVKSVPFDENFEIKKEVEKDDLAEDKDQSQKGFARKRMRRIEEVSFDFSEDAADENDVIDDYTTIDDEEPVRADLELSYSKVTRRLTFSILTFIVAVISGILPSFNIELIYEISQSQNLTGFLVANIAILAVALIINISSFFRGLGSLIRFKPDSDSALSVASLFVIAQSVIAFVPDFTAAAGKLPFFTSTLIFGYILSLLGKKSMVSRVKSNFRLVATTTPKQVLFTADDRMGEMLENDEFIGVPNTAVSKSVINLHNYLRNSYCEDPSDRFSRIFAPISLLVSVATLVVTYFMTGDIVSALTYAAAVSILAVPVSAILSINSPLKKAAGIMRSKEALLTGYEAVKEFSDVDCVAIDAEDIFPAGAVELLSLRAFGDVSIEDIILKSAALTINAGGPLADVFDKIIDGRRKMLPPISDIVYEDGLGLSGKVDGKMVRIGNRKFIDSYGIYGLSDDSLEAKAKKGGFFVVYTAVEDEVCGMFAVKYKSVDPDIEDELFDLVENNIAIAVKTNDPNITPELIERVFEIPSDYVVVMESQAAEHYDEITRPAKNGEGTAAFSGNSTAFASLVVACKKLMKKLSAAVIIQILFTVLGFVCAIGCAVLGKGFEYITPLNIIGYQFAVAIIAHLIPSFIKRIK